MRTFRFIVQLITAIALSGCISAPGETVSPVKDVAVTSLEAVSDIAGGANDFAFRLTAALLGGSDDESFVCSPLSVWLPLAALQNAVDDTARGALLDALGAHGASPGDINAAAQRMMFDLTSGERAVELANAIFVGKNSALNADFARIYADSYLGGAQSVDFASQSAVDTVNKWVSGNTHGRIKNVIDKLDPETAAAIVNAIYFSDNWAKIFDTSATRDDTFHAASGDVTAPFMARYDRQRYYEDGDTQAVTMNFKSGGGLIVLLPKNADAKAFLASVDGDYFAAIRSGTSGREGTLRLLRFKLAGDTFSLKDALKSLGIPLFDKNDPHITGLTDGEELYITQAVQKAEIELDETGATASAATVIVVAPESMPNPDPSERFEMICNRPFAFILYGDTRDGGATVLFTGVVGKPAA